MEISLRVGECDYHTVYSFSWDCLILAGATTGCIILMTFENLTMQTYSFPSCVPTLKKATWDPTRIQRWAPVLSVGSRPSRGYVKTWLPDNGEC